MGRGRGTDTAHSDRSGWIGRAEANSRTFSSHTTRANTHARTHARESEETQRKGRTTQRPQPEAPRRFLRFLRARIAKSLHSTQVAGNCKSTRADNQSRSWKRSCSAWRALISNGTDEKVGSSKQAAHTHLDFGAVKLASFWSGGRRSRGPLPTGVAWMPGCVGDEECLRRWRAYVRGCLSPWCACVVSLLSM